MTPDRRARIFIAGHRGLVGSAITRALKKEGYDNLIVRTHQELDLTEQSAVRTFFRDARPEVVIMAAARVGGIHANNSRPAEFLRDNLLMQDNVIDAAYRAGAGKFVFLGSSCIYPRMAPQPITEDSLLTGPLEPTNEWYAVAKIAGLKMCQAYRREYGFNAIALMPTNLYGPGDNFDLNNSHVLPALLRKFHEAQRRGDEQVEIWGTGTPRREFLHVDDLADAVIFMLQNYDDEKIVNVGWGEDVTIRELAQMIKSAVGYRGGLTFDPSKPDGTPRKLLDVTRMNGLGWRPRIPLKAGIDSTYAWFKEHAAEARL
ncbi:MAG TPA: GDP-L-fucose synthase [Steroidobacteraceae bacterium]|nr:GDP-L-fucose synthase [Steroidobacteraceae bacterium]HXC22709.1 GDP-L-fucose synthase [Steroidobacteraceae bacterium]